MIYSQEGNIMSIVEIFDSNVDDISKIDPKLRVKLAREYKKTRLAAGISGSEMSELIGITAKLIYSIETGERLLKRGWHEAYCKLTPKAPRLPWSHTSLGDRLKAIRLENNLSVAELTKVFRAKKYAVQLWESGSMPPSHNSLRKYATEFGSDADELIVSRAFDAIKEKEAILFAIKNGSGSTVSILRATGLIRIVLAQKLAVMVKIGCIDRKRDGALWIYSLL